MPCRVRRGGIYLYNKDIIEKGFGLKKVDATQSSFFSQQSSSVITALKMFPN